MGGQGPAGRPRRNFSPADVSFRPGISVSPKRNGGASKSTPVSSLGTAVRANTRSCVRRHFSETGTLSPPSLRIVVNHTLQKAAASMPALLALPAASSVGQLAPSAHRVFLRLCGGHPHKMGAALDDWLLIRFHRRQQEALYPSSLSTTYPLGPGVLDSWSSLHFGTPFVV